LSQRRCRNHTERPAAGRCPLCAFFYCRECITEHDGRLLCAACVDKSALSTQVEKGRGWLQPAALLLAAFLGTWLIMAVIEGLLFELHD
jgi:hypothetical protein